MIQRSSLRAMKRVIPLVGIAFTLWAAPSSLAFAQIGKFGPPVIHHQTPPKLPPPTHPTGPTLGGTPDLKPKIDTSAGDLTPGKVATGTEGNNSPFSTASTSDVPVIPDPTIEAAKKLADDLAQTRNSDVFNLGAVRKAQRAAMR